MQIDKHSYLWNYLSQGQKDLLTQGEYLINEVIGKGTYSFHDYSFLVFPFAKAYEGFLKQLFLDVKFISRLDYISNHFRLGKVLSPNMIRKLGDRSVYQKIVDESGRDLADDIWSMWKIGRNQVFHYFPHNVKSISFEEAQSISEKMIQTMENAAVKLKEDSVKSKLQQLGA